MAISQESISIFLQTWKGSQFVSVGFRVAARAGVKTGVNGGIKLRKNIKILSPNLRKNSYDPGGTTLK